MQRCVTLALGQEFGEVEHRVCVARRRRSLPPVARSRRAVGGEHQPEVEHRVPVTQSRRLLRPPDRGSAVNVPERHREIVHRFPVAIGGGLLQRAPRSLRPLLPVQPTILHTSKDPTATVNPITEQRANDGETATTRPSEPT